jgi:hypothetical protein
MKSCAIVSVAPLWSVTIAEYRQVPSTSLPPHAAQLSAKRTTAARLTPHP